MKQILGVRFYEVHLSKNSLKLLAIRVGPAGNNGGRDINLNFEIAKAITLLGHTCTEEYEIGPVNERATRPYIRRLLS